MTKSMRGAVGLALISAMLTLGCGTGSPDALLASAKDYIAKKDDKAAIIQLKNALQSKPNLAEARFLLGTTLLRTGDPTSAEKELRKALELNYSREQVLPPLARSLVLVGQYKKLVDQFGTAELSTAEAKAEFYAALGHAHLGLRDVNAAERAFGTALAAQPRYAPAEIGQARIAAVRGDLNKALALVDSAIATDASAEEAWYLRGEILTGKGDTAAALAAYRKLVEINPDFIPAHVASLRLHLANKDAAEATKQLQDLRKVAPKHPVTLYFTALLAYRDRNYNVAQQAIQDQLKVAPNHVPGLVLAGAINSDLNAHAQAEAHLLKALQINPDLQPARRALVNVYLRSGQGSKALDAFKPLLPKLAKDPELLAMAGEVYMINGEVDQAAQYFTRASALDPRDPRKRTSLAMTHMARGETEKAVSELEETAARSSDDVRADLALIATHLQRRQYDKALAAIATLEKKRPNSAVPSTLRGSALLAKRDVAAARRNFERALELEPAYFPAVVALARLDFADNKPDLARQRIEAVLAKEPKHLQALLLYADLKARTGANAGEIADIINKAVAAHPNDSRARLALIAHHLRTKDSAKAVRAAQDALAASADRPEILDAAGRAYRAAGDTNQALAMYSKLAALQPKSPEPHLRMAEVHVASNSNERAMDSLRAALKIRPDLLEAQRGIIALHVTAGRVKDALRVAEEVQKQRPSEPAGYVFEGDVYAANKNLGEAAAAYRRGLKKSNSTILATKLYETLHRAGQQAEAEQFAGTWLKTHPRDDAFRMHLGNAAMVRKDYATAVQLYRKILDSQPENPVVLNNLAWTSAQLKDPNAVELAQRANKLAPDSPVILDTLGALLMDKGETAHALEVLRRAAELAPQSPHIRLNLAKALIKAGQKDAAKKELDQLAKLGDKYAGHAEVAQLKAGL